MSPTTTITRLGILGAGQMGAGIAQTAAQFGFEVLLADQSLEQSEKGKSKIAAQLKKQVEKGKLSDSESQKILSAIRPVSTLKDLGQASFVIEAATENPELKYKLFRNLDEACPPETLLATNTSSISITAIAAQTRRPEKVAGIHFMWGA